MLVSARNVQTNGASNRNSSVWFNCMSCPQKKWIYTRKKVQTIAKQRSVQYRSIFRAHVLQFTPNHFVWVDETGSDARNHIRKYGYAMRDITPVYHRLLARGRRISAITAISSEGLVGVDLTYGTTNGDIFADFVRGTLIPEMVVLLKNPL